MTKYSSRDQSLYLELIGEKVSDRTKWSWKPLAMGVVTLAVTIAGKWAWPLLNIDIQIKPHLDWPPAITVDDKVPTAVEAADVVETDHALAASVDSRETQLLNEQGHFERDLDSYLSELAGQLSLTPSDREELKLRRLAQSAGRLLESLPAWLSERGHRSTPALETQRSKLLETWQELRVRTAILGEVD